MAVNFLEEPHCRFEKTAIISNSDHLPVASKATEVAIADDGKESNECKHFTIRGYVAEVRKRDSKNCLPFLLHNSSSLESANVIPPLPVTKFRRWDCRNCVYEIISATGQMGTGGAISLHNKYVKSNSNLLLRKNAETSQLDSRKVLPILPQNLKENYLKEMLELNDCSVNNSRVGKKGKEWLQRDLLKEGVPKYKNDQDSQAQIQNAVEVNCLSYGRKAVNKGRRGKYRNSVGRKKLGAAYVKDALKAALVKHKRTKPHKVRYPKMLDGDATSIRINLTLCCAKEGHGPERKRKGKIISSNVRQGHIKMDVVARKNVLDADLVNTFCLGACCQVKRTCGVLVDGSKYMGLTDGKHQIENEDENDHNKKIRKVRLLEDIIRSEKQHMTASSNMLDKDTNTISQVTSNEKVTFLNHKNQDAHLDNVSKCVRSKSEIQNSLGDYEVVGDSATHIDQRTHCDYQRNQLMSVKRKDRCEKHSEDEGSLLMHWVSNMPKKTNASEGESIKHINSNSYLSNFSADLSGRKDQGLDVRCNGMTASKQKSTFKRKQNLGLNDGQVTSRTMIHEEMKSKKFSSQDISTNMAVNTEKPQETSDGIEGEAILHCIESKRSHRDHVKIYKDKDSSIQKKASLEVWEKVSKKPRSKRTTDQEALDDIPMDIVELLARNQHERFRLIAETDATTKFKLARKTENINCSFDLDSSQISRNIAADLDQGNLSCQNFQANNKGFDNCAIFPCNAVLEHEPEDCSCSINAKKKFQFDLNQHHTDSLKCGAGFCKDINNNCHHLNFSTCRRNNMYSLQSCLKDQTTCGDNLFRNPYHDVLRHRNGASFGVKRHFLNNYNASVLGSNLEMFSYSGDFEKPRNLDGKHHYWGFPPTTPNSSSFMDLGNGCNANFGLADLYSNETISALNLLRLMDQAACSGEPQPHFQSYSGFIEETDVRANGQCNGSQLGYARQEKEPFTCPLKVINSTTRQKPRNSCLLFRPLPRIGSLGPSLQKEIFNYSNYSSLPTRNSYGFLKTCAKEKTELSQLSPNPFICNSHNSFYRCKCSEKNCLDRNADRCSTSNTQCSLTKVDATRVELINKVDALLPLERFYKMEICVVNRNPAEFTLLDENNEYLIEIKELNIKSLPPSLGGPLQGQKKQRVMKLNDLKEFAMG